MHSKLKRKTTVLVYVTATRAKSGQQSVPDGSAERTKAKWSNGDVGRGECVCGGGRGEGRQGKKERQTVLLFILEFTSITVSEIGSRSELGSSKA